MKKIFKITPEYEENLYCTNECRCACHQESYELPEDFGKNKQKLQQKINEALERSGYWNYDE